MSDPSRPLACVPLRPEARRFVVALHTGMAKQARDEAHEQRRRAARMEEPYWRELGEEAARAADGRADGHEATAARWLP